MSHDENESGFVSHLAELRKRLINSFIFLIVFFIACYFFAEHLYGFLVEPFAKAVKDDGSDRRLIFTACLVGSEMCIRDRASDVNDESEPKNISDDNQDTNKKE